MRFYCQMIALVLAFITAPSAHAMEVTYDFSYINTAHDKNGSVSLSVHIAVTPATTAYQCGETIILTANFQVQGGKTKTVETYFHTFDPACAPWAVRSDAEESERAAYWSTKFDGCARCSIPKELTNHTYWLTLEEGRRAAIEFSHNGALKSFREYAESTPDKLGYLKESWKPTGFWTRIFRRHAARRKNLL